MAPHNQMGSGSAAPRSQIYKFNVQIQNQPSLSQPWLQRPGSRGPGDRLLSFSRQAVKPRTQLRSVRSEMRANATTSLAPIRDARTMRYGRTLEDERIGGCAPWEPIADADSIAVKPAEAADRRTELHSIRRRLPSSNGWPPCSRRRMIQISNFVSGQNTQRRNFSHQILCALSTIILKAYRFLEGCTSSVLS